MIKFTAKNFVYWIPRRLKRYCKIFNIFCIKGQILLARLSYLRQNAIFNYYTLPHLKPVSVGTMKLISTNNQFVVGKSAHISYTKSIGNNWLVDVPVRVVIEALINFACEGACLKA